MQAQQRTVDPDLRLLRIETLRGDQPQHRAGLEPVRARRQEELGIRLGPDALDARDLALELRSRRICEHDVAEGAQRLFETAAVHRRAQRPPCRERGGQAPRARPHQVVVHGRRVSADRRCRLGPSVGITWCQKPRGTYSSRPSRACNRAPASTDMQHRSPRSDACRAVAETSAEDLPALLPDELDREHVVRVPVLAERAMPADGKIGVADRRLPG